jgi:hypothetical protein
VTPIERPASVRGNTHARLDEVWIGVEDRVIYCRGVVGIVDEGVFTPDADLKPFYVDFTGGDFEVRFAAMEDPGLIGELIARNWGYGV